MSFTVPALQRLIVLSGTQDAPVRNITISGVGFRDAASTFMDRRWSAPSGGDWSLHRGGAVFIEGAANVTVSEYDTVDLNVDLSWACSLWFRICVLFRIYVVATSADWMAMHSFITVYPRR